MSADQSLRNRVRERAKLAVRGVLHRFDLELTTGPYPARLTAALAAYDVTTVLDIGANVGQFGLQLRRAGFAGEIVSCEPLAGAHAQLAARSAQDPRWHTVRTAVGREPGEIEINVSANSFSSSILDITAAHTDNAPGSGYVAAEKVPLTTVQALVAERSIDPARTLLKIDTQGYEGEVLAGAGDLVRRFAAIQVEMSFVELYKGQQLYDEAYAQLREWGLRMHALETGFSGTDGRLLQCDGLFVRDN